MPPTLAISSAPEDRLFRDALVKHLALLEDEGVFTVWHEDLVVPGTDCTPEAIAAKHDEATVIALLISSDYFASPICRKEMERAIRRAQQQKARVVPILLRPCLQKRELVAVFHPLPTNSRPVTTWQNVDDAWAHVAAGLQAAIEGRRFDPSGMPGWYAVAQEAAKKTARASTRSREPLDDRMILWLSRLEDARTRKRMLALGGSNTEAVDAEIIELKRRIRERGRVRRNDTILDRYTLHDYLGKGNFATVWEAEDRVEQRRVALKILHPNKAEDYDTVARFFRGARVMNELSHPAVVKILDQRIEDDDYKCFAMELIRGDTLDAAAAGKPLTRERTVDLISRVGDALAMAHDRKLVHRDVKPGNILLDADGSPKLTDFDLVFDRDTGGTQSRQQLGTFGFVAPEQADDPQHVDHRSDIFSLGMTALFCLIGHRPSERILERELSRIGDVRLADVLRRATANDPAERYQDMRSFCDALRLSVSMPPEPPGQDLRLSSPIPAKPGPTESLHLSSPGILKPRTRTLLFVGGALVVALLIGYRLKNIFAEESSPAPPQSASPQASSSSSAPPQAGLPRPSPLRCPDGMVLAGGEEFLMGSPARVHEEPQDDEKQHPVRLSPYCIDRLEVSTKEYIQCVSTPRDGARCEKAPVTIHQDGYDSVTFNSARCNAGIPGHGDHPINCVTWAMAGAYCRWAGKRLPTEAEWEYAARGTTGRKYPWGDKAPDEHRLNACGLECLEAARARHIKWDFMYRGRDPWPSTSPVGALEGDVSALGVRDMGGNVREWVADWYASYDLSMTTDPLQSDHPEEPPLRVIRGQGWSSWVPNQARAAYRGRVAEDVQSADIGFRCARSP